MADVSTNDIAGYSAYLKGQGVPDADIQGYTKYLADQHGVDHPSEVTPQDMSDATSKAFKDMQTSGEASNDALLNTLTFGHLPQIKAKAKQILNGEGIANDESYVRRRDQEISDMSDKAKQFPLAHAEGTALGFVAPMALTGGGSAVADAAEAVPALTGAAGEAVPAIAGQITKQGLIKAAAKGAAVGGAMGAAQNPGDTPGVVDPLQLDARKKNAEIGTALGGTLGAVTNKIPAAAEAISDYAEQKGLRASGAMLKDFRKAYANDSVNDLGRFVLDNKLVKAGDTYGTVAEKASAMRDDVGEKIGAGYDAGTKVLASLPPEAATKVSAAGFNPVRDKQAILDAVKNDMGYSFKGKAAIQGVSDYLDQLVEQHGDQTLNPKITNQIKTALDKTAINWERNPLAREPDAEAALKSLRDILGDKVKNQVGAMGEAIGNPEAAKNLADLNSKYGMASKIASIAGDRANRELANDAIGLGEKVAAGAGTAAGAAIAGVPGALIGGAVGGAANKAARVYGPAITADVANKAGQALAAVPEVTALQQANPAIYKAITGAGVQTKGPAKWANDGFDKLIDHTDDKKTQDVLTKNKSSMLADPKMKKLLISASDLKPGSKAMESVLTKIKDQTQDGD